MRGLEQARPGTLEKQQRECDRETILAFISMVAHCAREAEANSQTIKIWGIFDVKGDEMQQGILENWFGGRS